MKVLHVFKTYFPETSGGIERVIRDLCENAPDTGVTAEVAALTDASFTDRPVAVGAHRLLRFRRAFEVAATGFSFDMFRHLPRVAQAYDLLHYHFPWPFMDLVHEIRRIRMPYIVTYHADIVGRAGLFKPYRPLMRRFLRGADRIIATSRNYVDTSPTLARLDPVVIPLGISERLYPKGEVTDRVRPVVEAGRPYIASVGVNRRYKGFATLIEAARAGSARVVLASAGPRAVELEAEIARGGAENIVLIRDATEGEKMALLAHCTAFALPSINRAEAFGVSLVEAAMMGKPLISCEIGSGTTFVNVDGLTGLVVPPGDVEALCAAVERLCADRAMAEAMGRASRARFEAELSGERMAERYGELYRAVLSR